jgi:hypothetical protein
MRCSVAIAARCPSQTHEDVSSVALFANQPTNVAAGTTAGGGLDEAFVWSIGSRGSPREGITARARGAAYAFLTAAGSAGAPPRRYRRRGSA